ncbi:MAG: hypothetical protein K2H70_01530, partial [Bacteroidales bacterium]|nr:hypothetical protein [Bacteroidales bacterium]
SIRVQDPVDLDLDRVCFNEDWIKIYAYDVHDTCFWEADADFIQFTNPSTFNDNVYGDTIRFRLSRNQDELLKGTVTIKVKVGRTPKDQPDGELKLTIVPKASNVQDVVWQEPICQNLPIELRVDPIDENYQTGYAPGHLNLEWEFLEADSRTGRLVDKRVTTEDDFKTLFDFGLSSYRGGSVKATFYTCDERRHEAVTMEKTLVPFVVQGLYKDEKIYPMRRKSAEGDGDGMGGDMGGGGDNDKTDIWEKDGSDDSLNTVICRSYDDLWVGYIDDSRRYVYLGFGNFTERLEATDTSRFTERFYSYHWDFDPDEFEYARQEMSDIEKYDFGKSRIALRVKGGKEGGSAVNREHTVRLTVRCDECIERGGSEKDFTYTTSIKLYRQDSISDYHDETNPIDYTLTADGSVCANEKVKLQLSMDEQSTLNFRKISNAKYYAVHPEKKFEGTSAFWKVEPDDTKDISSDPNLFKYQYGFTAVRTDDWNGTPGDTI